MPKAYVPFDGEGDMPMYTPDWCNSETYDREGPTCVWNWEMPHRKVLYVSLVVKRPPPRYIKGTTVATWAGSRP